MPVQVSLYPSCHCAVVWICPPVALLHTLWGSPACGVDPFSEVPQCWRRQALSNHECMTTCVCFSTVLFFCSWSYTPSRQLPANSLLPHKHLKP